MSQKVVIEKVVVTGATPYLGDSEDGEAMFSRDPDTVMEWLTSGWRTRFNELRSLRQKYGPNRELVPIGDRVIDRTHKEAREQSSYLRAIPSLVLESVGRVEHKEWFASVRRRKTLLRKGANPGRMPKFKSRKHDDHTFLCWTNGGRNADFRKLNRHRGEVVIRGQNPQGVRAPGDTAAKWQVRIRVRISQPIRPYTSVHVNWTRKTVVFVNQATPVRDTPTGNIVGLDRGATHMTTDSHGHHHDLPKDELRRIDRLIRRKQKAQARGVRHSNRGRRRQADIRRLHAKATRIIRDRQHKVSTDIVRNHDVVVIERLRLDSMRRTPQPIPDPLRPGKLLPNGRATKRGLNRALARSGMGGLESMLAYKLAQVDGTLLRVDPRNTSRRCHRCHHIHSENRKSQAVFSCVQCGHTDNADINAALNILERGLRDYKGGARPCVEDHQDIAEGAAQRNAGPAKREPHTVT